MRNPAMRSLLGAASLLLGCQSAVSVSTPEQRGAGGSAGGGQAGTGAGMGGSSAGGVGTAGNGAVSGTGGSSALGGTGGANSAGSAGDVGAGGVGAAGMGGRGGSSAGTTSGSSGSGGEPEVPPCETNDIELCSGTSPIRCDFGGGTGDYLVTVEFGGSSATSAYVDTETNRRVLEGVELSAGETGRWSFGVNVRQPEGQPVQDVPAGTPGLQIYVDGDTPQLTAICAQPLTGMPKLWIAGDSTVCDQSSTAYAGWGQFLPQHFVAPVVVANYSDSGESSASVLANSRLWGAIETDWKAGDWVLVQVGHNDKTISATAFRQNMTTFVTEAKAADVHIVLITPMARVGGALEDQHQNSQGADLPGIIKEVGQSEGVPVIDLTTLTWDWLQTIDWTQYFALGTDKTHTNPAGAAAVAELVRDAIQDQQLELADYVR